MVYKGALAWLGANGCKAWFVAIRNPGLSELDYLTNKEVEMKVAMSGLLVALLAIAVPALAQTSTRHSGGRQAVSTQAQAQTGARYSGSRQTVVAQTGTRYSGGRQAGSTQTGTTTGTTTQTGTRDFGSNFRQHQQVASAQSSSSGTHDFTHGDQRQFQNHARDTDRDRHDGDHRGFGNDGRFQNGQGHAYGRQDGWRDGRHGNAYAWGHTNRPWGHQFQNNWRNGQQYGHQVRGWDPSIDRRENHERQRIAQGIRSGELTQHEAQRLIGEQRMIRQEERLYKSDGVVTPWERRDLQRDLDVASQHIYDQTHDAQRR